jgi:hypothetical protein
MLDRKRAECPAGERVLADHAAALSLPNFLALTVILPVMEYENEV